MGVDRKPRRNAEAYEHVVARLPTPDYEWLSRIIERRGAPRGVAITHGIYGRWSVDEYTESRFWDVFMSNFGGAFWLLRAILPYFVAARSGRIVIVGSQAGAAGGKDAVYAASKAACTALMKSLAREYGRHQIAVNIVAPGPVLTPMAEAAMSPARIRYYRNTIPIGRLIGARQVAEVVTFLLTSCNCDVNGATVDVDGGLVRR